jgi:poly(3-hydroxybutyrate) depolymerase
MAFLFMQTTEAQCTGSRYTTQIFDHYTVSTVTYSTVYSQQMDIYQPLGDSLAVRPLVILAHGGSFTGGNRTDDSTIIWLCEDLVRKGYVTASIDYRLTADAELLIADSAIIEVLRAVSDGKAAIRYFYQDVATNGNSYKIDTNNIFIGGNSAGAVLYMQAAYIDSISELNGTFQAILAQVGGLDGNSGNAGYSSNFKGVINLAGALNEPSWIGYCSKPVVSAQGTADPIVPYNCGNPEYGAVPVTLCGLDSLQPYITANTPYWASMTFPGAGHVPWQNGGNDFYMVDTLVTGFLVKAVGLTFTAPCGTSPAPCPTYLPLGIQLVMDQADITLYPNPGNKVLNIHSSQSISDISMYDETGKMVLQADDVKSYNYQLNTSHLSSGVYTLHINNTEGHVPTVKKVIID